MRPEKEAAPMRNDTQIPAPIFEEAPQNVEGQRRGALQGAAQKALWAHGAVTNVEQVLRLEERHVEANMLERAAEHLREARIILDGLLGRAGVPCCSGCGRELPADDSAPKPPSIAGRYQRKG
jgi:hypothetical protein